MLGTVLATRCRTCWSWFSFLMVHYDIWIDVGAGDNVCGDVLHLLLLWLARILALHLPLWHLLHLLVSWGCIVYIAWVMTHLLSLGLICRLLAYILVMCMVDCRVISNLLVLLVNHISQLCVVIEWLFTCLLKGEVCAVGHLLGLVMLLRGQALDKLIIFLDLLLVVLHWLKLQIDRTSIFKTIEITIKFKLLGNKYLLWDFVRLCAF